MRDTMTRYMEAISDGPFRAALRFILKPLVDRYSSQGLTSAGLVISAAGATTAKTGAAPFYATAKGILVSIPAGTVMPALTGVAIPAGSFGLACFFTDNGGNLTMAAGNPAALLSGVTWPQFPVGQALIGALIITGAAAFVGGTTPLDTATTVYVSPTGAFDPTVLV